MTYTDHDVHRLDLAAAKDELLSELLASPYDASERPTPTTLRPRRALRVALAGVAAAAVAAVGIAVVVQDHSAAPTVAPTERPGTTTPSPAAPISAFSVDLVAAAKRMPRLLLDAPGWSIETVYGFGGREGTLGFKQGKRYLELDWYPASQYDGYFRDREDDPSIAHAPTTLLGEQARLFTYSDNDHATMLRPSGRSFVELRGGGMDEATYLAVTAQLRQVGVEDFLEAMPASVVTPDRQEEAATRVLADIPVPPGFTFTPTGEVDDSYQFGAAVTGQVFCAWADVYRTGDVAAKRRAVDALSTSHHWTVLNEMNARGDWPEAVWEYADRAAAGSMPSAQELADGLDCR